MNKAGMKLSKLDRFLFSEDVLDVLPNFQVTALDRLWSDHIPILFHYNKSDFGLIPFKIYHSWFLRSDFDDLIKLELANLGHNSNGIKELACQLKGIEEKIEAGIASLDKHKERSKILHEVADIENFEVVDTVQKARIKWDMEGDENTKCFHGLVKQKRREKFQANESAVSFSPVAVSSILNFKDQFQLEGVVSMDEIKAAIWDWGSDKTLDGFSFAYWGYILLISDAVSSGLIRGIKFDGLAVRLSHLFYADDVVITMEWSSQDMDNIIRDVQQVLSRYLGLPIGSNMNHMANWKNLMDRFHTKLSSWKANLLSIGGGLTLIKSVRGDSQDTKKLAWIKWSNVMALFDKGGLGIGSLKSFNLALIQKWRWRLASNPSAL
ncbi:hypothetical protein Tco_0818925 [Tanacetum coccineum]